MYVDQTQFLAARDPKRFFGHPDIAQVTTLPCGCYAPIIGQGTITVGLLLTDTHMYMYTCTHQTQQSAQLPPLEEPDRDPRRDVHPVDSLRPAVLYDKSIIRDRSKLDHVIARTALTRRDHMVIFTTFAPERISPSIQFRAGSSKGPAAIRARIFRRRRTFRAFLSP
jgi:hypothetical protein